MNLSKERLLLLLYFEFLLGKPISVANELFVKVQEAEENQKRWQHYCELLTK